MLTVSVLVPELELVVVSQQECPKQMFGLRQQH